MIRGDPVVQKRRRAAKCCHLPVTPANIRACYRQEATARPGPATTGCQSLMLDAAEARHVATAGWSILPSRCDGRLRGQRLCVPLNGRGQTCREAEKQVSAGACRGNVELGSRSWRPRASYFLKLRVPTKAA